MTLDEYRTAIQLQDDVSALLDIAWVGGSIFYRIETPFDFPRFVIGSFPVSSGSAMAPVTLHLSCGLKCSAEKEWPEIIRRAGLLSGGEL